MFCTKCGANIADGANFCHICGTPTSQNSSNSNQSYYDNYNFNSNPNFDQGFNAPPFNQPPQPPVGNKSKLVAGLLGIFLGSWGVHNFYLGFTGKGVAQILVTIFTCGIGSLWGFIEGICILAGSIKTDANGFLLGE